MVMTVVLFKNSKVDGITRLGKWSSKSEQDSYFSGLTKKTYSDVPTIRLGEPIRLNDSLKNLLSYNYGYMDFGDGFRYYFTVGDLTMLTETMTSISYTIDVWDTAKTQTDMTCKRASITRYPTKIGKCVNPYASDYTKKTKISSYKQWNIVALYRDSTQNLTYTLVVNYPELTSVADGSWLPSSLSATDVISAGIVADFWSDSELTNTGFTKVDDTHCWKYSGIPIINCHKLFTGSISNDGVTWYEITDLRGNTVFTVPYGTTLTAGSGVVDISGSSVQLRYVLSDSDGTQYQVTIPSEIPTVIADAWQEYYTRQRSIDTETRNLQMNQQLMSGLASTASSVATGAVMGGIGEIGAVAGAGVAGGGGLLSTLGNYAISAYYAPKQQALIDKSYKNANDTIMMVGGASSYLYSMNADVGVIKIEWDATIKATYESDVSNNGYYVNYVTGDFDSLLTTGPIQATVEVTGGIPTAWKEQITSRFASGVLMV